ncbi:MAG: chromosome segregation protein SMC [Alphaproteobacteria bacterium]|nr:chromosome segregation protein SMC [Alphaproteobacteria bacterium]
MRFTNLRLIGFKSFVDTTDLDVRDGLTGVVGPNGCGKSNLLEALRWVMGATSAKALRGGGMADVVFSGTSMRPARNWAEVILTLDNSDRTAPAEYNDCAVLEVSRRIVKNADGAQSIYHINSKEVRAKDVQLLFADASTGANSPALVRQGQISELINAKPENRRRLLEEAAGVTGLHSRRHEAELRLRAAEQNLARLEDVTGELESQKSALARQARQATRYRNLSGDIRRTAAGVAYLRWRDAMGARDAAAIEADDLARLVEDAARAATAALAAREATEEKIGPLRMAEAEAAAALHRLSVARDGLAAEAERAAATLERLRQDAASAARDLAREEELHRDAADAIDAIHREREGLAARDASEATRLADAASAHDAARTRLAEAEAAFEEARARAADVDADRRAATAALDAAARRLEKLETARLDAERERDELEARLAARRQADGGADPLEIAERTAQDADARLGDAETACIDARAALPATRGPKDAAAQKLAALAAERQALEKILGASSDGDFPSVLEAIRAGDGYEKALAAALGDDLDAALDPGAPAFWRERLDLSALPPLPAGATTLADAVVAPPALSLRLRMVGVVDEAAGDDLARLLQPGQRLVSRNGALWRWDGFVKRADARSAAAVRLEQRNRLERLLVETADAEDALADASDAHEAGIGRLRAAETAERDARRAAAEARKSLDAMRRDRLEAERQAARLAERLTSLAEAALRAAADQAETAQQAEALRTQIAELPAADLIEGRLDEARRLLDAARSVETEARGAHRDLTRDAEARAARRGELDREEAAWAARAEGAATRRDELRARIARNDAEQATAADAPKAIETKRAALLDELEKAEAARSAAADALAAAEAALRDADAAARSAEGEASAAREARARVSAQLESAEARVVETIAQARETCDCAPESLPDVAEFKGDAPLPDRDDLERKLDRYKRERENLGGVNLRADEELQEMSERLDAIATDREDCEAAIRKLRAGIGSINREARERLNAAFSTVNANFGRLFTRLFNGGQAELRLTDSEDVLEAGLEIYASPPGKKLTSMSLMSGGEQALTATALIFAVFMANPAPVCVLDEVDAPLDDANTERFCGLLHQMAKETKTRFLVITHHALTMSRMDRLFGVTMMEQGVSRLVSVDLTRAEQLAAAE